MRRSMLFWLFLCLMLPICFVQIVSAQGTTPFQTLPLNSLSTFESTTSNWQIVGGVTADRTTDHSLTLSEGQGILVNNQTEDQRGNLFTKWQHADIELDLEVLMPKGSNSGIYFQSRYEVQLLDSWGVKEPQHSDLGGIYQRWDEERPEGQKGYEGHAPRASVARAPGLWQHLNIVFQAPRFDAQGNKISTAQFVSVKLNGFVIHDHVEVTGPTRAAAFEDSEVAQAPIMIQGDHGPVAFRNIKYRLFDAAQVGISNLNYKYYQGEFPHQMPNLDDLTLVKEEETSEITVGLSEAEKQFALRFEGTLDLPKSGLYTFEVAHSARFRLEIDGKEVLGDNTENVAGVGEFSRRRLQTRLSAGAHSFALTYAKGLWHNVPTALGWYVSGPGLLRKELTASGSLPTDAFTAYQINPEARPFLQRNFVMHKGEKRTHAISVGFPGGLHYAYDMGSGALLHIWKGPFIDTSTMWYQRGEMQSAVALGSVIEQAGKPAVATLSGAAVSWPDTPDAYQFHQYRINEAGIPAYTYTQGDLTITDRLEPDAAQTYFTRTLTIENQGASEAGAWVLLAESPSIKPLEAGSYLVDDQRMYIDVEGGAEAQIRSANGVQQLVMPVEFSNGKAQVQYHLVW